MKIYVVKSEVNVDGEIFFDAIPCKTEEAAKRVFENEKENVFKKGYHFSILEKDEYEIEDEPNHYFINDLSDDYYCEFLIIEKTLIEE